LFKEENPSRICSSKLAYKADNESTASVAVVPAGACPGATACTELGANPASAMKQ
jgi:hypothetical protein